LLFHECKYGLESNLNGKKDASMKFLQFFIIGLFAVSLCIAQSDNISISGVVTDTGGAALSGALVKLEKAGLAATTKANGSFTLGKPAGIAGKIQQPIPQQLSVAAQNGILRITIPEKNMATIAVFNLQGKVISINRQTLEAGVHSIALPRMEAGVYLYNVKVGKNEMTGMINSLAGEVRGSAVVGPRSSSHNPAKQAKVMAAINDIIAVTQPGYLNYRVVIYNSDTSGIVIKMIVCMDSVKDADRNVYQAVRIGNQVWTVENLRTTKYNDGTPIPLVKDSASWAHLITPGFCYYNNSNADSMTRFGALYNWFAVHTGKLAPSGWHVPTHSEWDTMKIYLMSNVFKGNDTAENLAAKAVAGQTDWAPSTFIGAMGHDLTKNNSSGFSALPGGYRDHYFTFYFLHDQGFWWSATTGEAYRVDTIYTAIVWNLRNTPGFLTYSLDYPTTYGCSVRLLRNF
jgi:uncharacterized protein (TIGR02145 family)